MNIIHVLYLEDNQTKECLRTFIHLSKPMDCKLATSTVS